MKKIKNSIIAIVALVAGIYLSIPTPVSAAQGTVYFSPGSGRIDPGSTFNVRVLTSVADPGGWSFMYSARVGVTYPNTLLQITNVSTAGNVMEGTAKFDQAAGTATYNASSFNAPYGTDRLLFTITFKAIGTGTAALGFSSNTLVTNGPTTKQGGSLTIAAAPPATCPSGQTGTPPNCRTPTPAPAAAPKPTPTPAPAAAPTPAPVTDALVDVPPEATEVTTDAGELTIDNVAIKTGWESNTINWATSLKDVISTLSVGTDKEKLTPVSEIAPQEDGTLLASLKELAPGTRHYYTITAALTSNPEKKATYTGAFTTKGYPTILSFSQNNAPLAGAKVSVDKGSYITDKNGEVRLELANKSYKATVTASGGISETVTFAVAKKAINSGKDTPPEQKFNFTIASSAAPASSDQFPIGLLIGSVIAGLALLGGAVAFLVYRRQKAEQSAIPMASVDEYSWSPPVEQSYVTQTPELSVEPITYPNQIDDPTVYQVESEQNNDSLTDSAPTYTDSPPTENTYQEYPMPTPETLLYEDPQSLQPMSPPDANYRQVEPEYTAAQTEVSSYKQPEVIEQEATLEPTQVETESEPTPAPTESDAVYDPSTGELDIIHHTPEPRNAGGVS